MYLFSSLHVLFYLSSGWPLLKNWEAALGLPGATFSSLNKSSWTRWVLEPLTNLLIFHWSPSTWSMFPLQWEPSLSMEEGLNLTTEKYECSTSCWEENGTEWHGNTKPLNEGHSFGNEETKSACSISTWSNKHWVKRKPGSPGSSSTVQDAVWFLCSQFMLLAHGHLTPRPPQVLFGKASPQPIHPLLCYWKGLFLPRCRTLHPSILVKFHKVPVGQLCPSESPWMAAI